MSFEVQSPDALRNGCAGEQDPYLMDSEVEGTPPEKNEYELARDRNVAEVQKRMAPVVAALQEW